MYQSSPLALKVNCISNLIGEHLLQVYHKKSCKENVNHMIWKQKQRNMDI